MLASPEFCKGVLFLALVFGAGLQFGLHSHSRLGHDNQHHLHLNGPSFFTGNQNNGRSQKGEVLQPIAPDPILPPEAPNALEPQAPHQIHQQNTPSPVRIYKDVASNKQGSVAVAETQQLHQEIAEHNAEVHPQPQPMHEAIEGLGAPAPAPHDSVYNDDHASIISGGEDIKHMNKPPPPANAQVHPSIAEQAADPNEPKQQKHQEQEKQQQDELIQKWLDSPSGKKHSPIEHFLAGGGSFPIILLTAKRTDQLKETLELLLKVRGVTKEQVTVLQDGSYAPTAAVVRQLGVRLVQNEGRTKLRGGAAQDGAALICSHYKFALGWAFDEHQDAPAVLVVEDDFYFSPDFLEYFEANAPLLDRDASTFVLSAWNDNGFRGKVRDRGALHRTEYFPGLGWLLTRRLWDELRPKWPKAHWDHFLRDPKQHKGRESVYPEVPRTFHNGKKGTFMDLGTHKKYFADIAYNTDATFRWPHRPPSYAQAAQEVYEPRLAARLRAAPAPAGGLDGWDALPGGPGADAALWYRVDKATPRAPQPFKPVGEFFGVWHEVERGSHRRLHEFDWEGRRVLLVDADGPYADLRPQAVRPLGPRDLQQGWKARGARRAAAARAGGGGGQGYRPVAARAEEAGRDCDAVCARAGQRCDGALFPAVNTCAALESAFGALAAAEGTAAGCPAGCGESYGPDQPVRVADGAPAGSFPSRCLVTSGPEQSTCAARHPSTRRLCPCV